MDVRRPLEETEFIAFDLETTGLHAVCCRIIEFGAVRFRLGAGEVERFEQLVDPGCPIPPDATRVNGIRDSMVRGMPAEEAVLPRFLEFLAADGAVLMAHNACFDLGFLATATARHGLAVPANPVLDTLDLARRCLPRLFRHNLETLTRHLALAEAEEHRALSDSRLVMGVFEKLIGRDPRLRTVDDLLCHCPPLSPGVATPGLVPRRRSAINPRLNKP